MELSKAILKKLSLPGWDLGNAALVVSKGPLHLWNSLSKSLNLDEELSRGIAEEFASSVKWQSEQQPSDGIHPQMMVL